MKTLFAISFLIASPVFAHVEPGTFRGITAEGKDCSMLADKTYFEGNVSHPLNERITITVDGQTFTVSHPPVINSAKALVSFNHDLFQGLLPTSGGAQAIEIQIEHSDDYEGPKSFIMMNHAWKTDTRTSYKCENLKHIGK